MSGRKVDKTYLLRKEIRRKLTQEELRIWTAIPSDLEEKVEDITGVIQRKAHRIRQGSKIDWLKYKEDGSLEQEEYAFVNALQYSSTQEERDELIDYCEGKAFKIIVKALGQITDFDEGRKLLVVIDDLIWEDFDRIKLFNTEVEEPWKIFQELLECRDEFIQNISSRIMIQLITKDDAESRPSAEELQFFMSWLIEELRYDNAYLQCVAKCLQALLTYDEYRETFTHLNGIHKISHLLSSRIRPQIQYQLCFCLWVASFNPYVAERLVSCGVIPIVSEILECCPSEITKLPRVIFASFRNMLEKPAEYEMRKQVVQIMLQCKIQIYLSLVESRVEMINDPEYIEDYEEIRKTLQKQLKELSSFDEYLMELKSGKLEWTPPHTSKRFWVENVDKFNENKYELLKLLLDILKDSEDDGVLCIAAHDVGEYMKQYVRGKKIVENLGGKDVLVKLLAHGIANVKTTALRSLQILMLNNYNVFKYENNNENSKKRRNTENDFGR